MRFYHSMQYYEELFCCHADTACYTSLGQLTAPKLSTHRFTDSSLVEQDGLWSSSAPTHSPLTNPSARHWQREASPWSEAFQVEIASCCSRKKKKTEGKESCQHLCWDLWGSLQPFAVCHMSFQQEPGGGRCAYQFIYKLSIIQTIRRLHIEKHAYFQFQVDKNDSRNKCGLLIPQPCNKNWCIPFSCSFLIHAFSPTLSLQEFEVLAHLLHSP